MFQRQLTEIDFVSGKAGSCRLVIGGCGGGGTHFAAGLLNRLGVRAGHEEDGPHAHCGWYATPWLDRYAVKFLQVRDPREVIRSFLAKALPGDWQYAISHIGPQTLYGSNWLDTHLQWAVWYVYHWYSIGERKADWVYPLEKLPELIDELLGRAFGSTVPAASEIVQRMPRLAPSNKKHHSLATWDEICALRYGPELFDFARRHGYSEKPPRDVLPWQPRMREGVLQRSPPGAKAR